MSKLSLAVEKQAARAGDVTVLGPLGRFVELDQKVDQAEEGGILARWEFGREVLARRVGKQLPKGLLDEIAAAIGKDRQEVVRRAAFATLYPTREEVSHAMTNFRSWYRIVNEGLTQNPRLAPSTSPDPLLLPAGKYSILLADPPWQYDFVEADNRAIENQYPTLTADAIACYEDADGRPVADLPGADAVLFLWATNPKLVEALTVLEGWGFTYVTNMAWVKDKIGMGYWARQRHELLLIGRRGDMSPPPPDLRPDSVIEYPRGAHSAKPPNVHELIDRVWPDHRKVEVFGRQERPGWEVFGNQVTAA